jgi:hypothetical protein
MHSGTRELLLIISCTLVVFPAVALAGFPAFGRLVADSSWTLLAWAGATALGVIGCTLSYYGLLQTRLLCGFWAPLYSIGLYTLALRVFVQSMGRAPRAIVPYVFPRAGELWDRVFGWSVMMLCVLPVIYLLAPH